MHIFFKHLLGKSSLQFFLIKFGICSYIGFCHLSQNYCLLKAAYKYSKYILLSTLYIVYRLYACIVGASFVNLKSKFARPAASLS